MFASPLGTIPRCNENKTLKPKSHEHAKEQSTLDRQPWFDPEVREVAAGRQVAAFHLPRMIVTAMHKVSRLPITMAYGGCMGSTADAVARISAKDHPLHWKAVGTPHLRSKDGSTRYITEVVLSDFSCYHSAPRLPRNTYRNYLRTAPGNWGRSSF